MRIAGIILIVLGAIALVYDGFSYTRRRDTVRLGPMSATVEQRERVSVPPLLAGVAIVAGIAMFLVDRRRRS